MTESPGVPLPSSSAAITSCSGPDSPSTRLDFGASPDPAAATDDERVILHVDIDAFFASVEQLRYPRLRGRPVLVGSGVIASCSYEARRRGCYAGQPLGEARRLCPEAVILDGCEAVYRAFAEKTFAVCAALSPSMETFLDEAVLDLTGCRRLLGDAEQCAADLKAAIRREVGLPVTVGVGPNRMLAKIAGKSAKPDGLCVIRPADVERMLPGLPVDRLPGVGPAVGRELARLNVRTVGDLRAFSVELLERLFGGPGRDLHDRCRGRDTRPVDPREVPLRVSRETAFHEPAADPAMIEGTLYYLQERAVRHARSLGLRCRTVQVWIDYRESGRVTTSRTLAEPSDQDAEVFALARCLLHSLFTRREALRRVGVALSRFTCGAAQGSLFDDAAARRRERLARSLDAVRSRFGHAVVAAGPSVRLLDRLPRDRNGFVLRTPSLTK